MTSKELAVQIATLEGTAVYGSDDFMCGISLGVLHITVWYGMNEVSIYDDANRFYVSFGVSNVAFVNHTENQFIMHMHDGDTAHFTVL